MAAPVLQWDQALQTRIGRGSSLGIGLCLGRPGIGYHAAVADASDDVPGLTLLNPQTGQLEDQQLRVYGYRTENDGTYTYHLENVLPSSDGTFTFTAGAVSYVWYIGPSGNQGSGTINCLDHPAASPPAYRWDPAKPPPSSPYLGGQPWPSFVNCPTVTVRRDELHAVGQPRPGDQWQSFTWKIPPNDTPGEWHADQSDARPLGLQQPVKGRVAITTFGDTLYAAYKAVDGDEIRILSRPPQGAWSAERVVDGQQTSHTPAITVMNGRLYMAYKDNRNSRIWVTSSTDGSTWDQIEPVGGNTTDDAPHLLGLDNTLYLLYRDDNGSDSVWLTWSKG